MVFFGGNDFSERHTQAIGWFSFIYFLFTSPKLLLATLTAIGLAGRRFSASHPSHLSVSVFTGRPQRCHDCLRMLHRTQPAGETKEVTFASTQLPSAFDGYRIVQLSDLHIGSWVGQEQTIRTLVEQVNALNPDLIVFTGDLVNHRAVELDAFRRFSAD